MFKVLCDRKQLIAALSLAEEVTPERRARLKPIFGYALLSAEGRDASVRVTDGDGVFLSAVVRNCEIKEPGSVLVPYARAAAFLAEVKADEVQVEEAEGSRVVLRHGWGEVELDSLPADGYPGQFPGSGLGDDDGRGHFLIDAPRLANLLRLVGWCCNQKDDKQWAIHGVALYPSGDLLEAVATTGTSLVVAQEVIENRGVQPRSRTNAAILPKRAAGLLARMLELDRDLAVRVVLGPNVASFTTPYWSFAAKMLEGLFPDYAAVLSEAAPAVMVPVVVGPFMGALSLVASVEDVGHEGLVVTVGEGTAFFAARGQRGRGRVELPIPVDGRGMSFTVESKAFRQLPALFGAEDEIGLGVSRGQVNRRGSHAVLITHPRGKFRMVVQTLAAKADTTS